METKMLIRSALPDDAGRILEIYSYYIENTAITFEIDVPSPDELKKRITKTLARYPYLVLEEDGRIEGYTYAGVFYDRAAYDHSCEVTIYLDRNSHGKGYGRLLYGELEKELKARGIINLYACIADPVVEDEHLTSNSEQFHAHLGYVKNGEFHKCGYKFGRWYNMIYMEKIIGEHY